MPNPNRIMPNHNSRDTRSLRSRTMRLNLITLRRLNRTMRRRHLRLRIRLRLRQLRINSEVVGVGCYGVCNWGSAL